MYYIQDEGHVINLSIGGVKFRALRQLTTKTISGPCENRQQVANRAS